MSWAAPLAFGWLALALLVLLFYLLRPRRQRIMVASVLLWRRTLRRQAGQTWLDWLKRHLLLILQVLAVAALALALARPERQVLDTLGPPVALVIDASLSMQIEDVAPNRLEAAKQRAREFVRQLPGDTRVSVIAAAGAVQPLVIASTDRLSIRAAIDGVQPSAAGERVAAALDMALSLAPAGEGGFVALFSDGSFELPVDPAYDRVQAFTVGGAAANLALEDFAVRRRLDDPARVQAVVAVRNYGPRPVTVAITLRGDRDVTARATLSVPASGREVAVFDDLAPAPGYEALISADGDALLLDNRAFAELAEPRELSVLVVGDDPEPIVRGLQASPGVHAVGIGPAVYERADPHDIYVFQGWLPDTLPTASLVLVRPPAIEALEIEPQNPVVSVPQPAPESPLLAFLDPLNVTGAADIRYGAPDWARPDLTVDDAVILAHGVNDGRRVVLVGLNVAAPPATVEPWYPIFWNNIVRWADPFNPLPQRAALTPGPPVVLVPHPQADRVEIVRPDGSRSEHSPVEPVVLVTDAVGTYAVRQYAGGELLTQARVTVEPPPGAGAPAAAVRLGGQVNLVSTPRPELPRSVELWPLLLALALAFLLAEWWWFHRIRGLR